MCSPRIKFVGLIFTSQARNSTFRPTEPFQERDTGPFVIPATHIPQHQRSTSRAATSSGLSQGRLSRMSWQRHEVQREELLDAVSVESPEVKPNSEETN
jgi:hypothetical protein